MRNDNHNEMSPVVRRSTPALTAAVLLAVGTIAAVGINVGAAVRNFGDQSAKRLWIEVPLQHEAVESLTMKWRPGVEVVQPGYAEVTMSDVDSEILAEAAFAQWVSLGVTFVLGAIALSIVIAFFAGRLRWNRLAVLTTLAGVFFSVGSLLTQSFSATVGESVSMWLYFQDTSWTEPGFVSGINFIPIVIGLSIAAMGISIRTSARYAKDAEGVI